MEKVGKFLVSQQEIRALIAALIALQVRELPGVQWGALGSVLLQVPGREQGAYYPKGKQGCWGLLDQDVRNLASDNLG